MTDMVRKIMISVEQQDLDAGAPCSGTRCAAARAIDRRLKPPYWCAVSTWEVLIFDDTVLQRDTEVVENAIRAVYRTYTSKRLQKLVEAFDSAIREEVHISPGRYTLKLPAYVLK